MSKQKDGRSAFPVFDSYREGTDYFARDYGMSQRDYFAGKALVGMLASFSGIFAMLEAGEASRVAKAAFIFADAMMEEGGKQNDA